jgi:hypothetical protein
MVRFADEAGFVHGACSLALPTARLRPVAD